MVQAPWEFVTGMRIDSLGQTKNDPHVHGQDVQITGEVTPEDRAEDCAETQNHDFDRRGVFSS